MEKIVVSTPSRLCLFGEHQDYLGLEVIALAINLRFRATLTRRADRLIHITFENKIFSESSETPLHFFEPILIDLTKPILYSHQRDYLKSAVNGLIQSGWDSSCGYDIVMSSEIPIGKGMSSSTTMIIALIKVLLEATQDFRRNQPEVIAQLAFEAEVTAFNEPGGKMDHYISALGGLLHIDFRDNQLQMETISNVLDGEFILFDSLADKNTTLVLKQAKDPVLLGMSYLKSQGINTFNDFRNAIDPDELLKPLPPTLQQKMKAQLLNDRLRHQATSLLTPDYFDNVRFGKLLTAHHQQLKEGLGLSTPAIDLILTKALAAGAYGGKINGSGGGGCCFVYAPVEAVESILEAIRLIGYPGIRLGNCNCVQGVRRDLI